jgi:protein-tyrosine phosphatase
VSPADAGDRPFTILLVCTGNICRSALAQQLGRAYLDQSLGEDAGLIRLVSAGTQAVVGSDMHPLSALVLRGYGVEAGEFRAQQLRDRHATQAGPILTMTRGHRRDVLHLAPRHLARTFTLREAAALLDLGGNDVPNPIGRAAAAHEEAGELIVGALLPILARLAALRDDAAETSERHVP